MDLEKSSRAGIYAEFVELEESYRMEKNFCPKVGYKGRYAVRIPA